MRYTIKLALKSIRYRKSTLLLSIVSIAMSVVLLLGVERIRHNIHESFTSTISGTDLIVGARSGNIPLLLSTVFHIGYPNQNVSWETYEALSAHPKVEWTIPLSLGDSHKGFAVLSTDASFLNHFKYGKNQAIEAQIGEANIDDKNCVLGSKVAKELGYAVGDELVVTHGMGSEEFITHDEAPFIIRAILKPTGTPIDQTVLVSLHAMDEIHAHFYGNESEDFDVFSEIPEEDEHDHSAHNHDDHDHATHNHAAHAHDHGGNAISGFMVGLENRTDVLSIQRMINEYDDEPLTAIMPVVTLFELWEIVTPIEKALLIISALVLLVALGGILTTIMTGLNERRREMAILRSVGAKPKHIFSLIMIETLGVILSGIIVGVVAMHIALLMGKPIIASKLGLVIQVGWFSLNEFILLLLIFVLGGLIGFVPAWRSYKNSMADGLMVTR
jgi:putative ABC transport system permease protein